MIGHVRMFVCLFQKRFSGSSYTVENASSAALVPRSPEMEPPLAAVGSATVAVLSQSSGIAAILCHGAGSPLHVVQTVPWLLLLHTKESSKREVCVLGTPSSSPHTSTTCA